MHKVSIVINNFNYAEYLRFCIDSALEQSFPCEIIVVDDGSTDNSRDIIFEYGDRISSIFKPNEGQISACNSGFFASSGDIILFLDADDLLYEDAAARIVERFSDPTVAKVHWRLDLIDPSGKYLGVRIPSSLGEGDMSQAIKTHGVLYPSSPSSGNAYRRTVLERLMPLPASDADKHGADFFLIYGAALFGNVSAVQDTPLGAYRSHRNASAQRQLSEFGNGRTVGTTVVRFKNRSERFKAWVTKITGGSINISGPLLDFSVHKIEFCQNLLDRSGSRTSRIARSIRSTATVTKALIFRPSEHVARKLALLGWIFISFLISFIGDRALLLIAGPVLNPSNRAKNCPPSQSNQTSQKQL